MYGVKLVRVKKWGTAQTSLLKTNISISKKYTENNPSPKHLCSLKFFKTKIALDFVLKKNASEFFLTKYKLIKIFFFSLKKTV